MRHEHGLLGARNHPRPRLRRAWPALWFVLLAFPGCAGDQRDIVDSPPGAADGADDTGDGDGDGPEDGDDGQLLDVADGEGNGGGDGDKPISCDTLDEADPTSVGCEFWGIDYPVDNENGGAILPYGITLGNPWEDRVATVEIQDLRTGTLRTVTTEALQPMESKVVAINGIGGILGNEDHAFVDAAFRPKSGLQESGAFRVVSDQPITAVQINPVGGAEARATDSSMLLPVNALDRAYIAAGYYASQGGAVVSVVATEDDTTVTTERGDVTLNAFDVYHYLVEDMEGNQDTTGFFVGADAKVAVFSGSLCSLVPALPPSAACDHLEEQMTPLDAWGTEYAVARHPQRVPDYKNPEGQPEAARYRIIAAEPDTTVHLVPPVFFGSDVVDLVSAGDYVELATAQHFWAGSDKHFMVVQYMTGCGMVVPHGPITDCTPADGAAGDPYMAQIVPREQWIEALSFSTDRSYARDFITITREAGTPVSLDCLGPIPDSSFTPIYGSPYEVAHVDLDIDGSGGEGECKDGQQYLRADEPVGVMVGGVDWAVSYGNPGGMRFSPIYEPPGYPPEG
jgi:hypothetical protein